MRNFITLCSFLIICIDTYGQDTLLLDPNRPSQADALLGVTVGIPSRSMQKAIKNNMGNVGFGLALQVLSNPFNWGKTKRDGPIRIGGELSYTYYGRFKSTVDINGYEGDYKTSYGIGSLTAILRLRPPTQSKFIPFFDILGGLDLYMASIKENLTAIETALGTDKVDLGGSSSASFNKGIGAGFSIGPNRKDEPRFYFRITYNRGTSISYIVRNSLEYDGAKNIITYQKGRAPVQYFMIQVGVGI